MRGSATGVPSSRAMGFGAVGAATATRRSDAGSRLGSMRGCEVDEVDDADEAGEGAATGAGAVTTTTGVGGAVAAATGAGDAGIAGAGREPSDDHATALAAMPAIAIHAPRRERDAGVVRTAGEGAAGAARRWSRSRSP